MNHGYGPMQQHIIFKSIPFGQWWLSSIFSNYTDITELDNNSLHLSDPIYVMIPSHFIDTKFTERTKKNEVIGVVNFILKKIGHIKKNVSCAIILVSHSLFTYLTPKNAASIYSYTIMTSRGNCFCSSHRSSLFSFFESFRICIYWFKKKTVNRWHHFIDFGEYFC
jgi:hypothetical protein